MKAFDSTLAILSNLLSGFFVGIVASKMYENNKTWYQVIGGLGWLGYTIFGVWIVIMIVIVLRNRKQKNEFVKKSEHLKADETNALIKLTIECLRYPNKRGNINVHIYFKDIEKGKIILRKDRRFHYEQESFPHNHTFDYAIVDEDELVICDSFKRDVLIFTELKSNHTEEYNQRLKDKVDPNMKWVLSCPLHNPRGEAFGVVCCFGSEIPFYSDDSKNNFAILIEKMSDCIVRLLLFEKGKEFNFIN